MNNLHRLYDNHLLTKQFIVKENHSNTSLQQQGIQLGTVTIYRNVLTIIIKTAKIKYYKSTLIENLGTVGTSYNYEYNQ